MCHHLQDRNNFYKSCPLYLCEQDRQRSGASSNTVLFLQNHITKHSHIFYLFDLQFKIANRKEYQNFNKIQEKKYLNIDLHFY